MALTKATQNVILPIIPLSGNSFDIRVSLIDELGTFNTFTPTGNFVNNYPEWSAVIGVKTYKISLNSSLNYYDLFINNVLVGGSSGFPGILDIQGLDGSVKLQIEGNYTFNSNSYTFNFRPTAYTNQSNYQSTLGTTVKFAMSDHNHEYLYNFTKVIGSGIDGTRAVNFYLEDQGPAVRPRLTVNHPSSSTTGDQFIQFQINSATTVGSITRSASGVAYGTTSDYRLKENISPIDDALSKINSINPVKFNFKSDENKAEVTGFIAHEIQEIIPQAVIGVKDAEEEIDQENEDGTIQKVTKIIPQMVDYSAIIPILTKAIQELSEEVASLKSKLNP